VLVPGDIADQQHCKSMVERAISEFGKLDILVNNAAFQRTYEKIEDITAEEWDRTFRTNVHAMFYLSQAAVPHMRPGAAIVNTTSIQSKDPSPQLLAYAATKGAISNFTAALAQMLADRGIRVNAVAPGPIWTPLIPSTTKTAASFGQQAPLSRAGQPKELAPASCCWRRTRRVTFRERWCRRRVAKLCCRAGSTLCLASALRADPTH
jgi:NAD(P)-dependent dehydrogenase (short-subunit alcohol dehydrogenase family)